MKILIWIICFIIANIVQMILLAMGISGAIPIFIVYSIMFYGGKKLCDKYVGQKQSKYEMLENKKKSDEYYKNKEQVGNNVHVSEFKEVNDDVSMIKWMNVTCPKCGKNFQVRVFESINTDYGKDVPKQIIDGSLFAGKCPHCMYVTGLEYDVLYNDLVHKAMIWVVHPGNGMEEKIRKIRSLPEITQSLNKITRIVTSMKELREKVACIEAGKDDRVVELCKDYLCANLVKQNPEFNIKECYFVPYVGRDRSMVEFYNEKGQRLNCYLDEKDYKIFEEMFEENKRFYVDQPFQIIDSRWAYEFITGSYTVEDVVKDEHAAKSDNVETAKIMFCRKCGAKLLDDSVYCMQCGTKVR